MVGEASSVRNPRVTFQGEAVMTVPRERNVGLSEKKADVPPLEETVSKVQPGFFLSLLVLLWVIFVMAAYFSQYLQSLCVLLDVPVLCTL